MSYDLYYVASSDGGFDQQAAYRYLETLPHCKLTRTGTSGFQAWYQHPDTGVYWSCAFEPQGSDDESPFDPERPVPAGCSYTGLAFNLNFVRPHFFGLEAIPYAARIARDLGLDVYDPQGDGTVSPPDAEKLTRSWSHGNKWPPGVDVRRMGHEASLSMWRYNSNVEAARAELAKASENSFVPTIMTFAKRGTTNVLRTVIWGWSAITAFPPCDAVIIVTEGKPTLLQRLKRERATEKNIAVWGDVVRALGPSLQPRRLGGLDFQVQEGLSENNYRQTIEFIPREPIDSFEYVNDSMFVDGPVAADGDDQP